MTGYAHSLPPLPQHAAHDLDHQGFFILRQALDAAWLADLRDQCDRYDPGRDARTAGGNAQLRCIRPDQTALLRVVEHPNQLAAALHVVGGPVELGNVAWRSPRQGLGQQGLHTDTHGAPTLTALWALDDFTHNNGPTRVVPGSHRWRRVVPRSFADPAARHPAESHLDLHAGDAVFLDGHLWHSGTRNASGAPRRVLQVTFLAWTGQRTGATEVPSEALGSSVRFLVSPVPS